MGMVVRTNTMAVNSYRQLNMNQAKLAKSLEKLASGFRINRAADDASGLAISEKMKAQIVGLEQASANSLDGISLVQTAEGALTEVHAMLNRMVLLATKSANGTIDDPVDRVAIQLEVDALLDEINRIGDSANFNGIQLLNGNLAVSGGNVTLSKAIDNRFIIDKGTERVAATKANYIIGDLAAPAGNQLPIGLDASSTEDEIAKFFGISTDDYKITTGDAGTMAIEAKVAGVDKNRAQILTKAMGQAWEETKGAEAYDKITLSVEEQARDLTLIGKTMNINGKTYTFVGTNDLNMDKTTEVVNNGDKLADGSFAIIISVDTNDNEEIASAIVSAVNNVEFLYGKDGSWDELTGAINTVPTITADFEVASIDATDANKVVIDPAKFTEMKGGIGGLTLQIGDTADDFNKVTVSVDNMKVDGLGLTGLNVSTQEAAGNAIQTIKDAINKVSTNRAKLGALQNRLEYTINNLDVMAENMMAANSRIRDTDMAKEMMEYTKMSILVQSAMAMLAQANMQPQSILQLLQ